MNIQEIRNLSVAERISMIEQIWNSLDRSNLSVTDVQKTEVRRRIDLFHEGKSEFFSWKEIKEELHKTK